MQKQRILCVTVPPRTTRAQYEATAVVVDIGGVKHLICDLYMSKIKVARYAVNDKEFGKYLYLESKWTKRNQHYYDQIKLLGIDEDDILKKASVNDKSIVAFKEFGIKKEKGSMNDYTYMQLLKSRMRDISYEQNNLKEQKALAEKDRLFALLPDVPEEFEAWAKKYLYGGRMQLVYKRETRYRAVVSCCSCGTSSVVRTDAISPNIKTIPTPRVGEIGICQWCKDTGMYITRGRFRDKLDNKKCYLFQNLSDGSLVIRYYTLYLKQFFEGHEYRLVERARLFLDINKRPVTYWNYRWFNDTKDYWHQYNMNGKNGFHLDNAPIYPGYEAEIKNSSLRYANYEEYAYVSTYRNYRPGVTDKIDALSTYAYSPSIEFLYKAGLEGLVRHLVLNHGVSGLINKKAKTIPQLLKIKSSRVNMLKAKKGNKNLLEVLQFEQKKNLNLTDDQIDWLMSRHQDWSFYKDLEKLMQYMSLGKIINRVNEYKIREYNNLVYNTWIEFRDYINMRAELGYDMTNSVFLHPRSLKEAHAEMVAEQERRKNSEHIKKMQEKYADIPNRYKALNKKYGMESNGYVFIPAKSAEEIIIEGRSLHHCVGGENYLNSHNTGETAIIFMRAKNNQITPYVTIEVRKDEIRQWYGAYDKKPDEEATLEAIKAFEKHIKKKTMKNTKKRLDVVTPDMELRAVV